MHDNIIRLNQKLKGLQAEIAVKLQDISDDKSEFAVERNSI